MTQGTYWVMAYPQPLRFGDLTIDLSRYRVLLDEEPLLLSYREYALLLYLAGRAGQVVPKRRLLEEGLGRHDVGGLRMVDEHLRHLKHVLERTAVRSSKPWAIPATGSTQDPRDVTQN